MNLLYKQTVDYLTDAYSGKPVDYLTTCAHLLKLNKHRLSFKIDHLLLRIISHAKKTIKVQTIS